MQSTTNLKEALERDFAKLAQTRDELRVQLQLAKAEARDDWKKLEHTWRNIELELKQLSDHAKQPAKEIGGAARTLMDELKRGYARIKSEVAKAADQAH